MWHALYKTKPARSQMHSHWQASGILLHVFAFVLLKWCPSRICLSSILSLANFCRVLLRCSHSFDLLCSGTCKFAWNPSHHPFARTSCLCILRYPNCSHHLHPRMNPMIWFEWKTPAFPPSYKMKSNRTFVYIFISTLPIEFGDSFWRAILKDWYRSCIRYAIDENSTIVCQVLKLWFCQCLGPYAAINLESRDNRW
jgi:hypothetical protein